MVFFSDKTKSDSKGVWQRTPVGYTLLPLTKGGCQGEEDTLPFASPQPPICFWVTEERGAGGQAFAQMKRPYRQNSRGSKTFKWD